MNVLLQIVNTTSNKNIYNKIIRIISNLCQGSSVRHLEIVETAIPTLVKIVQRETAFGTVRNAVSALFYFLRGESKIQKVVETGVVPSIVSYLR